MFKQYKLRNYKFILVMYVMILNVIGILLIGSAKPSVQSKQILVQKQPVIETESYGAENIRDTKRFYPILGRDVHSGYESTCFLSEEDYKKREIGDTITMTRFIWK